MALPGSGRMSSDMIRGEFGGGSPMNMSGYYRGGSRVPNTSANSRISTGGRIAHSMFYGARKEMSAQEVINDYLSNLTGFSRIGDRQDSAYPNGWFGNYVWPFHKSGKPGTFDWTYYFSNMAHPAGDSSCTIAISQAGRGPGPADIQSIRKYDGSYIGFTRIYAFSADDSSGGGWSHSIYHIDCDRREIASIVVRHYTWGWGSGSLAQVTLLPTKKWKVIGVRSRIRKGGCYVGAGEVALMTNTYPHGGWMPNNVTVSPALVARNEWHNNPGCGIIPGDVGKTFSIAQPDHFNDTNIYHHVLLLKFLPDDQAPINHDRLRNSLTDITTDPYGWGGGENLMYLYYNSRVGSGTEYFGSVFGVCSNQALDAELVSLVSYTCDNPKIQIFVNKSSIYGYPISVGWSDDIIPYNATITVRTQLGRVVTGTVKGSVRVARESQGG